MHHHDPLVLTISALWGLGLFTYLLYIGRGVAAFVLSIVLLVDAGWCVDRLTGNTWALFVLPVAGVLLTASVKLIVRPPHLSLSDLVQYLTSRCR